jgi:hypothetical protein
MAQRQDFRRIGLLVPSSSSVQERDFCRVLPEDITLHVARMRLSNVEAESTLRIVQEIETESQKLADVDVASLYRRRCLPRPPKLSNRDFVRCGALGRLWPFATCGPETIVGRFRGRADMAGPAAGSTRSRMTHYGPRAVPVADQQGKRTALSRDGHGDCRRNADASGAKPPQPNLGRGTQPCRRV